MADIMKLQKPEAGQTTTIASAKDTNLELAFSPADASMSKEGDNLVFTFEDGSKIEVTDFYATVTKDALPDFIVEGQTLSGADFFAALDSDLMPAAGPAAAAAPAGGGRFNNFGDMDLHSGLDRLDGLDIGFDGAAATEAAQTPGAGPLPGAAAFAAPAAAEVAGAATSSLVPPSAITLSSVSSITEGSPFTVTATVSNAPQTDLSITLSVNTPDGNPYVITIPAGETTGSVEVATRGNDLYSQGNEGVAFHIAGTEGGNYASLDTASTTVTTVQDDSDATGANISLAQDGTSLNVTVSLTNPVDAGSSATVKFAVNGSVYTHTFTGDETSCTQVIESFIPASDAYGSAVNVTAAITEFTGGNFEARATGAAAAGTFSNDAVPTTLAISVADGEENSATVQATITLSAPPTEAGTITVTAPGGAEYVISLSPPQSVYTLAVPHGETEDVYVDAKNIEVSARVEGGGYALPVASASDMAHIADTMNTTTAEIVAIPGAADAASVTFNITLDNAPDSSTFDANNPPTVQVQVGAAQYDVPINAEGKGTLEVPNPYMDHDLSNNAPTLTATVTGITGGNFEAFTPGAAASAAVAPPALPELEITTAAQLVSTTVVSVGGEHVIGGNVVVRGSYTDNGQLTFKGGAGASVTLGTYKGGTGANKPSEDASLRGMDENKFFGQFFKDASGEPMTLEQMKGGDMLLTVSGNTAQSIMAQLSSLTSADIQGKVLHIDCTDPKVVFTAGLTNAINTLGAQMVILEGNLNTATGGHLDINGFWYITGNYAGQAQTNLNGGMAVFGDWHIGSNLGLNALVTPGDVIVVENIDQMSMILSLPEGYDLTSFAVNVDGNPQTGQFDVTMLNGQVIVTPTGEIPENVTFSYTVKDAYGNEATQSMEPSFNQDSVNASHGIVHEGDVFYGSYGNDVLVGDAADNILFAGSGDDILYGGDGSDTLMGGHGNDYLFGGDGNDILVYSADNLLMDGGNGIDVLLVDDATSLDALLSDDKVKNIEVFIKGADTELTNMGKLTEMGITVGEDNKVSIGTQWEKVADSASSHEGYTEYHNAENSITILVETQKLITEGGGA